jgi:putative glutamine amidotransferase
MLPLIALPADSFEKDGLGFHSIGDKYVRALAEVSNALPVMIPNISDCLNLDALLDRLDGIVITGATSNVHPPLYGQQPSSAHEPYDHDRDATTLKLIQTVIARGMPLFCICRGFQELNVAMGGTLDTEIQNLLGRLDHRAKPGSVEDRYGLAHEISIRPESALAKILGKTTTTVNTVHRQAIAKLAPGLMIDATAPDGTIEAISIENAKGFHLATQWHPEYRASENPDSVKLFKAFGEAARAFNQAKR